MTLRKPTDPDAITLQEAAWILGVGESTVAWLRRWGLLGRLPGHPSYSQLEVEELAMNPWLTAREVAELLGISRTRVGQLADRDKLPYRRLGNGRRLFRLRQIQVVANARLTRDIMSKSLEHETTSTRDSGMRTSPGA